MTDAEPQVAVNMAEPETIIIRAMLTMDRAIDLFVGDLARRGYSDRTRTTYSRILLKFDDRLPTDLDVSKITSDDCRRFLDQWNNHAQGTRAHTFSVLASFFDWLVVNEKIRRSPLATIARPKRRRPDELDVVAVNAEDVRALLAAAQTWTEKLAIAIPAYIGPRRKAVATLRLRDYDREKLTLRFREKGGKTIWKPVPDKLVALIDAAIADGAICDEDDYLVPPEGHLSAGKGDRDDRVIWRVVKRVAERAGVEVHVHALRAAFAVYYLEQHPGDTHGLKELLGHRSFDTTQIYLRKLDKHTAMERVRDLSWDVTVRQDPENTARVYFVAAGDIHVDGTPVKIGWAESPERRLEALQTANHVELTLVATFAGGVGLESQLHADFDEDRIRGEWFRSTPRLRALLSLAETRMSTSEDAHLTGASSLAVGAGGFEPPLLDLQDGDSDSRQPEEVRLAQLTASAVGFGPNELASESLTAAASGAVQGQTGESGEPRSIAPGGYVTRSDATTEEAGG